MIASWDPRRIETSPRRAARVIEVAVALGWLLLAGVIGRSYLGESASPYGVCYAPSGRSVPCGALARR